MTTARFIGPAGDPLGEDAMAIPQVSFCSAPALEVRPLGMGWPITQDQMLDELLGLPGDWRLETEAELFALFNRRVRNPHGARSIDDTIQPGRYWSSDWTLGELRARGVVNFTTGGIHPGYVLSVAYARAIRVAIQPRSHP